MFISQCQVLVDHDKAVMAMGAGHTKQQSEMSNECMVARAQLPSHPQPVGVSISMASIKIVCYRCADRLILHVLLNLVKLAVNTPCPSQQSVPILSPSSQLVSNGLFLFKMSSTPWMAWGPVKNGEGWISPQSNWIRTWALTRFPMTFVCQ